MCARVPECQKIKNGGLDLYGVEHFGRRIFATNVGINNNNNNNTKISNAHIVKH